jgi:hypothetical protein
VPLSESERAETLAASAGFVAGQLGALPARLHLLLAFGLGGFRAAICLRHPSGFCALPLARRQRLVDAWAHGPVPAIRQLFRAVSANALLAFFENPPVRAAIAPRTAWTATGGTVR